MKNNTNTGKWRLNLFDVVFIVVVVGAAFLIVQYLGRSGGGVAIISPGPSETVQYTVELLEMTGDSAHMIKPGDEIVDRIERRVMGTVVSVDVRPAVRHERNLLTGERLLREIPGRNDAVVVLSTEATVTDSQISAGGFIIRAGVRVSVNGPLYHGFGFITDVERSDAS